MSGKKKILVAGDVCLDVIAVRMPPPVTNSEEENWKLSGETRIHYLLGGSMLLAEWVRAAMAADKSYTVIGPRPMSRGTTSRPKGTPMKPEVFLSKASRLCRDDMVDSLLEVSHFLANPPKKKDKTLRVDREGGYSGPEKEETLLPITYEAAEDAGVIVLDDTGNQFRQKTDLNPWPAMIKSSDPGSDPFTMDSLQTQSTVTWRAPQQALGCRR